MGMTRAFGSLFLLAIAASVAVAAAQAPLLIPRIDAPPAIDGRLDEPLWSSLVPLPMVTYKPTFGVAPSESTDVRMAHDGRVIYVGAALFHRDPAGVQPWSRARDEDNGGDFL